MSFEGHSPEGTLRVFFSCGALEFSLTSQRVLTPHFVCVDSYVRARNGDAAQAKRTLVQEKCLSLCLSRSHLNPLPATNDNEDARRDHDD